MTEIEKQSEPTLIASCGEGWYWIINELDEQLRYIDPNYEIMQIKEKFGGLRYYYSTNLPAPAREIMYRLAQLAEIMSLKTCEKCGNSNGFAAPKYGTKYDPTVQMYESPRGWVRTLCATCAEADGFVSSSLVGEY